MSLILLLFLSALLVGPASPVNAADLTATQLKNGKYFIPSWENPDQGEWVQLKDGEFNRSDPDNPLNVRIVDLAVGRLANLPGPGAAVIYGFSTGGTGFFMLLAAVVNDHGQPKPVALANLEDRAQINSVRIHSGKIIVDLLVHGPTDPAPWPTVKKIATYAVKGNKLIEQ
jgi:hypothetical protein